MGEYPSNQRGQPCTSGVSKVCRLIRDFAGVNPVLAHHLDLFLCRYGVSGQHVCLPSTRGGFESRYLLHKSWCKRQVLEKAAAAIESLSVSVMVANITKYVSTPSVKLGSVVEIYALNLGVLQMRQVGHSSCGGVQAKPAYETQLFGMQYYRAKSPHDVELVLMVASVPSKHLVPVRIWYSTPM